MLNVGAKQRVRSVRESDGPSLGVIDPSLPGSLLEELLAVPLGGLDEFEPSSLLDRDVYRAARRHRILPMLRARWMEPDLRPVLRQQQRSAALFQLQLEGALRQVLRLLGEGDVEIRVLKGLATGPLDYPEGVMRQTGDVDVLVRPDDLKRVTDVLAENGYRVHEVLGTIDDGLLKGATYVSPQGVEVDVHTRLSRFLPARTEMLFADPEPIGDEGLALPAPLRLIHAAGHLVWSRMPARRLSGLVDVSVMLDRGVDLAEVLALSDEMGATGFVGPVLRIERQVRQRESALLDGWPEPGRFEQQRIEGDESLLAKHALSLRGFDDWGDRVSYVGQFLYPGRAYLAQRGGATAYYGQLLPNRLGAWVARR